MATDQTNQDSVEEPQAGEPQAATPGQDQETTSSVTSQDGHESQNESTGESVETPELDPKEIERLRKEAGKLRREQEEKQQLQQRFQNVSNWIQRDPEIYKRALTETGGMSEQEAEMEVRRLYPSYGQDGQGAQQVQQPVQQPMQPPVYQPPLTQEEMWIEQEMQAKQKREREMTARNLAERKEAVDDFVYSNKDKLSSEEINLIVGAAGVLERKSAGQLKPKDAIKTAYERFLGGEKQIETAKQEGRLEGLAEASGANSATLSSPSGGTPKGGEKEPHVPQEEWDAVSKLGVFKTKSEYVLYRDNPKVGVQ